MSHLVFRAGEYMNIIDYLSAIDFSVIVIFFLNSIFRSVLVHFFPESMNKVLISGKSHNCL